MSNFIQGQIDYEIAKECAFTAEIAQRITLAKNLGKQTYT